MKKIYFTIAKPALKYKLFYVILLIVGVILIISDLAFAQNSRNLFDLAPNIPQNTAIQIILYFIIIIAVQFVFGFINSYTQSYLNESVVYEMRRSLLNKVQRMPIKFFDLNHSSNVLNIFFNQLESVKNFVVFDIQNILRLPVTFILVGTYLFTVHPFLAVTALLASALQLISNTTFKKSLGNAIDEQRKVSRDVFHTMEETMQGIREVKINQVEDLIDSQMKDCQTRGVKYNLSLTKYRMFRGMIKEIPMKVGYIFGISMGILLMISGKINPGDLIAFITLLGKMSEPFEGMVRVYVNYQESSRNAQELIQLMQEHEENYTNGEDLSAKINSIKFTDVSFKYDNGENNNGQEKDLVLAGNLQKTEDAILGSGANILENINFEIKGGSTIALVGPSGSGKSTIVRLLYRFYDAQQGAITINDKLLTDYNINSLRRHMAIVSQDVFIFDGTVYDNLILGRTDITEADVINALKFSQSYDFVQKLPDGLHTKLGERGVKISQGQKQRISIARAIIKKANIIILDEPTSALDVDTESSFQKNLGEWAKDCTKIIIAHRLTTIRNADYVLFLDNGKIVEEGSPQELIKKDGRFKEYWEKQFLFQENTDGVNENESISATV